MTDEQLVFWLRMTVLFTISVLTLGLFGCSVSTGGYYVPQGPHPHVNVALAGQLGPVQVLHAPLSNTNPVGDLTRVSLNIGPTFGRLSPTVGAGWAWFRSWGACDAAGYHCAHDWTGSLTVGAGLTYRVSPARVDGALHCYDGDAPMSCAATFMLGLDL